ncbi:hypothetical protein CRG98_008039 [Punica granatum]|uniref:Uncharacterized protein n=1 Tax=Punica granatum TaxID=22663 RepID=A0A2I0KSR8_PUNGR|nr:hypothetical protein CRG98_008039 [Punica granatum]
MKALLVQYGLEGALEGEKLSATLSPEERKTVMSKALSAIQLSLLNKILREVCDQDSAPKVWGKLELLYQHKSLTCWLYLKQLVPVEDEFGDLRR